MQPSQAAIDLVKASEGLRLSESQLASLCRRLAAKLSGYGSDGCWIWTGRAVTRFGYGRMTCGRGVNLKAHRAAWMVWVGELPDDACVLHRCDNPRCCNPAHLFLGTPADNTRDMVRKGRMVVPPVHMGEPHHNAKLTNAAVEEIRESLSSAPFMARKHKVSAKTIYRVRRREAWRHVA